jgi:hypothetical protein
MFRALSQFFQARRTLFSRLARDQKKSLRHNLTPSHQKSPVIPHFPQFPFPATLVLRNADRPPQAAVPCCTPQSQ